MIARDKVLGKLGKIGGRIFVSAAAMRREMEALSVEKLQRLASRLELVRRDEFEAVQAMAKEARLAQIRLEKRLDALEKKAASGRDGKKMPSARKAKPAEKKPRK